MYLHLTWEQEEYLHLRKEGKGGISISHREERKDTFSWGRGEGYLLSTGEGSDTYIPEGKGRYLPSTGGGGLKQ